MLGAVGVLRQIAPSTSEATEDHEAFRNEAARTRPDARPVRPVRDGGWFYYLVQPSPKSVRIQGALPGRRRRDDD